MTIHEAISRIDNEYENTYSPEQKKAYLSRLDWLIKNNIIDKHQGGADVEFNGYDDNTPEDTVLLVPEPFTDIYIFWLQAWIDYWNGDYDKYNNTISIYQSVYDSFRNDYNSKHMPLGTTLKVW